MTDDEIRDARHLLDCMRTAHVATPDDSGWAVLDRALDALAREAKVPPAVSPARHWMVMQDPDGSWSAWSCGPHEGYKLYPERIRRTREQAEADGVESGLKKRDGKVTP